MEIVKPPKQAMPSGSIDALVKKHEKATRDLSDTLSQTGQFELRKIKADMERLESGKEE